MSSDIAIRVENIRKCFQIYQKPQDRLKQSIYPRLQRFFKNQSKQYYKEFWALKDISLEVKKGESVAIIGRNGSGKSSLLQIICGTLNPTSGILNSNGRIAALLELGSGFNPEFNGIENIYLNASILGLTKKEINERLPLILEFADIGEYVNQPVKTYSSGMCVRLAFAVIAHVDADILIVDEALAVGDAVFTTKCYNFIRNFLKRGSLIFVSHDMQSVVDFCDRAIWLKDGEIVSDGISKDIVSLYNSFVHQKINHKKNVKTSYNKNKKTSVLNENKDSKEKNSSIPYHAEVYQFDYSSDFWGVGGAEIVNLKLFRQSDNCEIKSINGAEDVVVRIFCLARTKIVNPIIGFSLRNTKGLELISENTSLGYLSTPVSSIEEGIRFHVDFLFSLPYLRQGEYFFGAAIAEKTQEGHIQHQRREECLMVNVISSRVFYGLFSMPIENCLIEVQENDYDY